jgi:hypothetical protein
MATKRLRSMPATAGLLPKTLCSLKITLALLILCATCPAHAQTCSGMSLGTNANLNGFVPFPTTNAWNTNIASAPVDPESATITAQAGFAGLYLHPDFGSEDYYGIPYVVVDSTTQPLVPINVIDYASESDVMLAPYPYTAPIEGGPPPVGVADCEAWPDNYVGDSHVLVVDRAKCELYETFNTHRCNGQWASSSETVWDMTNGESRPWGWTSADAAGLAIFPGLLKYDEAASGTINHAIRFTMEHTKDDANDGYFVEPASHAAGDIWGVYNIMGMRIRLKADYDISGFSSINQAILTAMKQYGMILADNGGYFFFQGASDPRWDDNDLDNLKNVPSSAFEVVKMTPVYPGWDSVTAPTGPLPAINSFTASATSVASGSPVTFTYSATGDSYDFIDMIGPVTAGSGSVTVSPTETQTYTLNSTNAFGRTTSQAVTVKVPGSVVAAPVFAPAGGTYTSAQTVSIGTATSPNATIHYTTNGTTPTTGSPVFSIGNPITVSSTTKVQAIAVVPGYAAASAVGSATYTVDIPVAATPKFSVAAGTYYSEQFVGITDATSGAAIYYTTNGDTPTASSTKYSGAIKVESPQTIKAIAIASGDKNSAVASAGYVVIGSPTALADVASAITSTGATVNAVVDTRGAVGSYYFQYSTASNDLSSDSSSKTLTASSDSVGVNAVLTGLKASTKYYYRVVVSTKGGEGVSAILSFTTK